jgi:hypothetical protein
MMFRDINTVYSEDHWKFTNTLSWQGFLIAEYVVHMVTTVISWLRDMM